MDRAHEEQQILLLKLRFEFVAKFFQPALFAVPVKTIPIQCASFPIDHLVALDIFA